MHYVVSCCTLNSIFENKVNTCNSWLYYSPFLLRSEPTNVTRKWLIVILLTVSISYYAFKMYLRFIYTWTPRQGIGLRAYRLHIVCIHNVEWWTEPTQLKQNPLKKTRASQRSEPSFSVFIYGPPDLSITREAEPCGAQSSGRGEQPSQLPRREINIDSP